MSTSQQAPAGTRLLARVLGPYLVIVTATAVVRASHMRTVVQAFGSSSVWPWVTGAFVLLGGLVVIAVHPYWRGVPAIIVSLVGWLTALKGLALLAFPRLYISAGDRALESGTWWRVVMVIVALFGLYLTFVGWVPARSTSPAENAEPPTNLPRAA